MEQNPSYSTCFHAIKILHESSEKSVIARPRRIKTYYDVADLVPDNFIHTSSVLFRSDIYREMPAWFYEVSFGDWAQHLLRANHGPIGYIDDCMSVYRVHSGGRWSGYASTNRILESIEVLRHFNTYTQGKYDDAIKAAIQRFQYSLVLKLLEADQPNEAQSQFDELLAQTKVERHVNIFDHLYVWSCLKIPLINRLLTKQLKHLRRKF